MAGEEERELPDSFVDGLEYFNTVLLPDQKWFGGHEGRHIAVYSPDEVIIEAANISYLTDHMKQFYPGTLLYMPHVVRLEMPEPDPISSKWPAHMLEAEQYLVQVLRRNSYWMQIHLGKHVAIIGRQIVGEEDSFHLLSERVRPTYGVGSMLMVHVTTEYPEVLHFRPRMSIG